MAELLEGRVLLNAGLLDTSFGNSGIVTPKSDAFDMAVARSV
jgi:hypothetical protein